MKNGLNMPTPEEIKKIVRDYIEREYPSWVYPSIQIRDDFAAETCDKAIKFLRWLSKDYVIVPKSKLQEIDNIVCGTFSIGNIAVRQSWEYVKRKLFEEEK